MDKVKEQFPEIREGDREERLMWSDLRSSATRGSQSVPALHAVPGKEIPLLHFPQASQTSCWHFPLVDTAQSPSIGEVVDAVYRGQPPGVQGVAERDEGCIWRTNPQDVQHVGVPLKLHKDRKCCYYSSKSNTIRIWKGVQRILI